MQDGREFKSFPVILTKTIEDRTVTGISAVIGNIDSYSDIIHRGAFKKTIQENGSRVRHLWQHDYERPPIAAIRDLREVGRDELPAEVRERFPEAIGGLLVARRYLETPRGDEVLAGIEAGAINEMSIAYNPVKWDYEERDGEDGPLVRNLRELRLWDTSDVNWGANPATVASKAALPFRDTGTTGEDTAWSAPTLSDFTGEAFDDLSAAERRRIAAHFAWTANDPPEAFGDLKLPHHRPGRSGVGPAVWRGVAAAMGALLGARGGVDIPAGERRAVYNHLARHYEQYDKEPPDFKLIELAEVVARAQRASLRTPAGLDGERLADALCELQEALRAEPPRTQAFRALTPGLLARLEIAKHNLSLIEE